MPAKTPATAGLLLAGGAARRMGGGDKALLPLAGRPLLTHVATRLAPQCALTAISANGDPQRFAAFGFPVVPDALPDRPGPLAGILAGLDWLALHRPALSWLVSVAADTPFIPPDLVVRLHAAREAAGARLACAASGGRTHPVIGLWPVGLRETLRRALTVDDERGVGRFARAQGLAIAEWNEPPDPFFNVNTPDDLAEAERLAAERTG